MVSALTTEQLKFLDRVFVPERSSAGYAKATLVIKDRDLWYIDGEEVLLERSYPTEAAAIQAARYIYGCKA